MSFKNVETTLSAAVVQNGTFTVNYPAGTDAGAFYGARHHKMWVAGHQSLLASPDGFTLSFGASNITVTYKGATAIPANTRVQIQLDTIGPDSREIMERLGETKRTEVLTPVIINLGAPDTLDADGVCASQTPAAGDEQALTINGALASGGVATFDQPRNVVVTSAGNDSGRTFTVTGTDEYGQTVVEAITGANAGAASGKKAFKTVTEVLTDDDTAGAVTVGSGDVLGLPVMLPEKGFVVKELEDGAGATAGTLLAGVTSAATATTGDVRGTYDPNSACNGSKVFQLLAYVPDPSDLGVDQYDG